VPSAAFIGATGNFKDPSGFVTTFLLIPLGSSSFLHRWSGSQARLVPTTQRQVCPIAGDVLK
jgi:hypothetical protein